MQYNININQLAWTTHFSDCDLFDATIFLYIEQLCNSKSKKLERMIIDNVVYTRVHYNSLLEKNPMLGLHFKTKMSISERVNKKLKVNGLVLTHLTKDNTLYVAITEKADLLRFVMGEPVNGDLHPVNPDLHPVNGDLQHNNNTNNKTNNTNKKKTEKFNAEDYLKNLNLNNEILNLLIGWLEIRKIKKVATTQKAIDMNIEKLSKFDIPIQIQMIKNSIMNGWQGIFEIKQQKSNYQKPQSEKPKTAFNYEWMPEAIAKGELQVF